MLLISRDGAADSAADFLPFEERSSDNEELGMFDRKLVLFVRMTNK